MKQTHLFLSYGNKKSAIFSFLLIFFLLLTPSIFAQDAYATIEIINNFNGDKENPANYFGKNYSDDKIWLFFKNTTGNAYYFNNESQKEYVTDTHIIQLSSVKDGKFYLELTENSAAVYAVIYTGDKTDEKAIESELTQKLGSSGPTIFTKDTPYALAEWTIKGNSYDNADVSYEDNFCFPTIFTVYKDKNATQQIGQASFQAGTQAEDIINSLKAEMPNEPVGPDGDFKPTAQSNTGWGPLVPTVTGDNNANSWIGSSKNQTTGPDSSDQRGFYIYAPSFNDYLGYLKANATDLFSNGITGWYIDYDGNNGYSFYLSVTGADNNYGLKLHNIRINTGAASPFKADPTAGTEVNSLVADSEITILANNANIGFPGDNENTNVKGFWTDAVIYSGAAIYNDFGEGPIITGSGYFADPDADTRSLISSMVASISASMATGFLGSDNFYMKKIKDTNGNPYHGTMYYFNTLKRSEYTKLFGNAWSGAEKYYDPYWKILANYTYMEGYLSPFNDRWTNFKHSFDFYQNYSIKWELGLPASVGPTDYSISGTVTGDVQNGVTITLKDDAGETTTTGADGTYSFTDLANGNYTVIPSLDGYTFNPHNIAVTIAGGNQPGKDFISTQITPGTYFISGSVSGDVKEGVTITLYGNANETTKTSSEGTFSFHNLTDGHYTVTPSLSGYSFSPASRSVNILGSDKIDQDFSAEGAKVALGSVFTVEADDIQGLPTTGTFLAKPRIYTKYDLNNKTGQKANTKELTKISKTAGSTFVKCVWTKKIALYSKKDFKTAQKNGTSAATWITDNQENLEMDLRLVSKEAADQSVQPTGLTLPEITNISNGGQDAKGNDTLVITGHWFGTKSVKVSREYTLNGQIKQQNMKVVKPTAADAAAGYKDCNEKPAFMNASTGASKVVVIVPSKAPKGPLNGTIVLNNGIAMATGDAP